MKKLTRLAALISICSCIPMAASAAIMYDQNVTPDIIFGDGNANGSFTTDRANGVELGLRGKLRFNESGDPENTFNSNGDGSYSFAAGSAVGQASNVAIWSLEWSVNTDYDDSTGFDLSDLTYVFGWDQDASAGTDFIESDIINFFWADHAIGNNSTANGEGEVASFLDVSGYNDLLDNNNVAQNSAQAHWLINGIDPTADGVYDFFISAFNNGEELASSRIQIIVGEGAADVPEPAGIALMLGGMIGLVLFGRKSINKR